MTPTQAVLELNELAKSKDGESAHVRADEILLAVLKENPRTALVAMAWLNAQKRAGFYYA